VEGGLSYPLMLTEVCAGAVLVDQEWVTCAVVRWCCRLVTGAHGANDLRAASASCRTRITLTHTRAPQGWLPEERLDQAMEKYDTDKSGERGV
jgi:hypothetical protein